MADVVGWYGLERLKQSVEYVSGVALKRHCDDAHGGVVDPKCNACREIQEKMELCK